MSIETPATSGWPRLEAHGSSRRDGQRTPKRALTDVRRVLPVRRGRHFGLEVHVLTQRVTDWFDSRIGRTIQSVAASKWFGQMEGRELYEIAPSLGISSEERDRIEKAGQGEGLLVRRAAARG